MPEYDETTHMLEQHGMPVARPQSTASDPEAGQYGGGKLFLAQRSCTKYGEHIKIPYCHGAFGADEKQQTEQDRLDFQHAGTHIIMNDLLAWAPIQSPKWVLDIATGTGIWASDFAEEHPESNVVGSDLTPIQPPTRVSNLSFVTEDAEEPWVYDHKFDYIHARYVYTCFDNPRAVIKSAFECLNPGGWLEFQDASPLLQSGKGPAAVADSPLKKMIDLAVHGAALQGRDILVAQHYKRWLEEAGFVDVREQKVGLPINEWHPDKKLKQAGLYHSRMMLDNLRGVVWKMVQGNGLSDPEIDEMVAQVKPEYRNLDIQGYFNL
ncbi:methyltransferase [Seiridium cupressi]